MDHSLAELVRTVAGAVEDLSKLVEGLPSRMDAKLAEVRHDFANLTTAMQTQMEELRVDAASLRGSLHSMVGAVRTEMADASNALASVIGDNRAALDAQLGTLTASVSAFESRVGEVATSVETASTKAGEALTVMQTELHNVNERLTGELDTQHSLIQQVRTTCDPTDLYAGLTRVGQEIMSTNVKIDEVRNANEATAVALERNAVGMNERVNSAQAETAALRVEITNALEATGLHIAEVRQGLEETRAAAIADVTAVQTDVKGLQLSIVAVDKRVIDNAHAAHDGLAEVRVHVGTMGELIKDFTATHAADVEKLNQGLDHTIELEKRIDENNERLVARYSTAFQRHEDQRQDDKAVLRALGDRMDSLDETLHVNVENIAVMRGTLLTTSETIGTTHAAVEQVQASVARNHDELTTAQKQVIGLIEDLGSVRALTEMVNNRINDLRDEATNRLNAITEEVRTRATSENLDQLAARSVQEIAAVGENFGKNLAALETEMRGALGARAHELAEADQALAQDIADVAGKIPPPYDATQLQADLQAWVGEQLVEHKMAMIGFDVEAGSEGKMVFTFKQGTTEIVREVKLGFGLEYRGVYDKEDETYITGNFVTHKGSMWYAKAKPTGEPGKDIDGWQLAVKCGRDGKDAKREEER